jgi:flagellar hook-associated protein 1 FlgK
VGDTFLIRPTRSAAQTISLQVTDATDIAAAGAVRGIADPTNTGDATISSGELITDTTDPAYVTPAVFNTVGSVNIQFGTSGAGTAPYADQYSLDGGTTWNAYTSGADIKLNGMKVQISGTPFAGDQFTMERNTGAISDNRNALKLAALQTKDTLGDKGTGAGPTLDYQAAYGQLVAMVGTKTHQVDVAGQAQQVVLEQAVAARDRVSGVNLDEEAANLLRMQQGYQASARVITTAQTLFQTLLDSVR